MTLALPAPYEDSQLAIDLAVINWFWEMDKPNTELRIAQKTLENEKEKREKMAKDHHPDAIMMNSDDRKALIDNIPIPLRALINNGTTTAYSLATNPSLGFIVQTANTTYTQKNALLREQGHLLTPERFRTYCNDFADGKRSDIDPLISAKMNVIAIDAACKHLGLTSFGGATKSH